MNQLVKASLQLGLRFALRNDAHEITHVDANSLRYAACKGGRTYTMPTLTFWQLVDDGIIGLLAGEGAMPVEEQGEYRLWQLNAALREEMHRRLAYVNAVSVVLRKMLSKSNLSRAIDVAAGKIEDPNPPSRSTLARWVKKFMSSGGNALSLVPRHDQKGFKAKLFSLEIEAHIIGSIRDGYLTEERPTVEQIYCNIVGRLNDAGLCEDATLPSRRTIYRRIAEIDPYLVARKRFGQRYADLHFRAAGASLEVSRLMEIVMIDGHRMDVIVVDPDTKETLGRAYLVCLFDVCTRAVVGWHISLLPFSATTALAAIKDMCSRDPLAGPGGIPEAVVPDNGPDLASNALRNLFSAIGIHIRPAKTYCPDDKAHLERFFRTLNQQLMHMLPGTTFSSPIDRGDYSSENKAKLTLEDIKRLFTQWVENVYHKHIHGGTHRAPTLDWRDRQAELPIMFLPAEDINVLARVVYKRTISNGRVIVDYLPYKSEALAVLEMRGQRDVTVLVDELNLESVYVQHESNPKLLIRADGTRPKYMAGLTKYEHDNVKRRLKEKELKDLLEFGENHYEIARWQLWNEIHELPGSKSARRVKLLTGGEGRKRAAKRKSSHLESQNVADEVSSIRVFPSTPPFDDNLPETSLTSNHSALTAAFQTAPNTAGFTNQLESPGFDTFEL